VPDFRGRIWSKLRGDAFVSELKSKGLDCACYAHPPLDRDNAKDFKKWIRGLRKPVALFVACDDQALTVIETCRAASLNVPRDVSVIGVDDDEIIDESCDPTLTSIRPNHERQGFIAAARLCDMMAGKSDVQRHSEIPILNISVRNSTRNESPAGILVQEALSYIAKNVRYGLDPSAVAHHFKVSRRLLDLRFREIADTSVNAAIREHQLADVCNRLKHSQTPIEKIAELCGFTNANYLKTLFKKRFGMTMRDFRKQGAGK
jgi:LacI family transcriptional regulator